LIVAAGPSALDHVGVQRPLCQEFHSLDLLRFFFETINERMPDPPPLFLRLRNASQRFQESRFARDDMQICFEVPRELRNHRRLLVFPQQPVIDQDARKLRSDRLIQ
jgi:hypothetical protein